MTNFYPLCFCQQKGEVQRQQKSLSRRQSAETLREISPDDLRKELRDHHKKQVESDKTIAALKLACAVSLLFFP